MNVTNAALATESEHRREGNEPFDPLSMYMDEVRKYPVLSKSEEQEIAKRIVVHGDNDAAQKLITANLKLVLKIARQYSHFQPNFLDVVQEGNLGLMRAVNKYDHTRGTKFSTYACFWIRAYILRYLMNTRSLVKIGTRDIQRKLFYSLQKEKDRLEKLGLEASPEILANTLDVTAEDVKEMESRLYNADVSLDERTSEDGESFGDTISSDEDIEENVAQCEQRQLVSQWLGKFKKRLCEKERFIFENRIMAEEPMALREIGQRFDRSGESVRQLQSTLSKKLIRTLRSKAFANSPEFEVMTVRARRSTSDARKTDFQGRTNTVPWPGYQ